MAKQTSQAALTVIEKCIKLLRDILGSHFSTDDWRCVVAAIQQLEKVAKKRR